MGDTRRDTVENYSAVTMTCHLHANAKYWNKSLSEVTKTQLDKQGMYFFISILDINKG